MKNKGFTLVELLIGISVAAVAGTILVSLMVQSQGIISNQGASVSQGLSINTTLSEISSTIKQANSINATYPPSGSPLYTTSENTLILKLPSLDAQGSVIENVYDYAVITTDPTNPKILRKIIFPDVTSTRKSENRVFATTTSLLKFTFLDNNNSQVSPTLASKVNFYINLTEKAGSKNKISSGSADVNLKNY